MKRASAKVIIEEYRAWFQTSIARNPAPTAEQDKLIKTTEAGFATLLADAKDADSTARQHLIDRGKELSRARVYVIPRQELLIEAHEAIADMRSWAVPAKTISQLTVEVVPLIEDEEATARGALRSLFETYDYWETYTSNHERAMRFYVWVMLGVMLLSLSGGVIMLHMAHVYSGIFCAGVAGGLLSIMSRMPKVMGVGDNYAYQLRILSRLGVGAVASFMGMGLLAADIITVKVQQTPIADILNGKTVIDGTGVGSGSGIGSGSGSGAGSGSGSASGSAENATDSATGSNAAAGVPSDAGVAVVSDAGASNAAAPPVAIELAAHGTDGDDVKKTEKTKKRLPQSNVLILMALAMLFAFSERALASFENAVLPSRTVTTKKKTSSAAQTPPTSDADAAKQAAQAVVQGKPPEPSAAPANSVTTTTTTTTDV